MARDEIQLTPAERRLLRRVFQRHALPYLLAMGLAVLWALGAGSRRAEPVPPPAPAPAGAGAAEAGAEARQLLAELRPQVKRALAELAAAAERDRSDANAAARQLAALEKRLEEAARQLVQLEADARSAANRVTAAQAPAAGSAGGSPDLSGILERLYELERQQSRLAASSGELGEQLASQRVLVLNRVAEIEGRTASLEQALLAGRPGAVPANLPR